MAKEKCKNCGGEIYPYYGTAPMRVNGEFPENFIPDPEGDELGVFTHCLECGDGK